jgi:hypothetical protein
MSVRRPTRTVPPLREGLIKIEGETFYAVPDIVHMPPFLMNVVSDGDRWMFVSSTGGLTAGRIDASRALFPYETDDRLHHAAGITGPVTALRAHTHVGVRLWRPFLGKDRRVLRNLYKSVVGTAVVFEEWRADLELLFRYRWTSTDRLGFLRSATLTNTGDRPVRIDLVDGLLGLLPYGIDPSLHQRMSNLTNAYKRSEVIDQAARLAVYSLESPVADRTEPTEILRATVAWSSGLGGSSASVDPNAIAAFEDGQAPLDTVLATGRPGAYLLSVEMELAPQERSTWHIVADVAQDQLAVTRLRRELHAGADLDSQIATSVAKATDGLVRIMAPADALQRTGDGIATAHHFANVTYNVMRGGVPVRGYSIEARDFAAFVRARNRLVAERNEGMLHALPSTIERRHLLDRISATNDADLARLGHEYLPLAFSRRHGDPSRPWNAFAIQVRDEAGQPILHYEGNWRDVFQNWEALSTSFPEYLPGFVATFVDASTADGFNPYRISRDGIDWELPDPHDPWNNIGYWSDHQIVYLLRLLEASHRFLPGETERLLAVPLFTYADVPYRIAPYVELVRNPKSTIRFDEAAAARSAARVDEVGGDGRLVWDAQGRIYRVTLIEKLLVPALAKLANFVPGGGIWMNTQRPEWNDANNALVGNGLSVVTVCQLRRYLDHVRRLIARAGIDEVALSSEVSELLATVTTILSEAAIQPRAEEAGRHRRDIVDALGEAFSAYRSQVYRDGFSGSTLVRLDDVAALLDAAIPHLDATIRASRRDDGLFHSYNLIRFAADGSSIEVEHLHEMLEGQVAVLESGVLNASEKLAVIDALFASAMLRPDLGTFLLYPARKLPSFLEKNVVGEEDVAGNPLLSSLLEAGDRSIIVADTDGRFRFHAALSGRADLMATLDHLAERNGWANLVSAHRDAVIHIYESVFDHRAYTGRSGSMYAYEGIGSIYWHMVGKLLVAVQESAMEAASTGAEGRVVDRLVDAYWRVRSGLGFNKTAAQFGAIPIDPYSHTPAHAGAQQPGMTGLVKEELLTRLLEVGIRIEDGEIRINPLLLRRAELVDAPATWNLYDLDLQEIAIDLPAGSLGMTLCQVPIVFSVVAGEAAVEVRYADGRADRRPGLRVDRVASRRVFGRSGEITRIDVYVPEDELRLTDGPENLAGPSSG